MLNLVVIIPLLTIVAILFSTRLSHTRVIAAVGMSLQLFVVGIFAFLFHSMRQRGNTEVFLFHSDRLWFSSLNIHYATGIDSISLWMLVLTAVVIFAGIFVSWEMEHLHREFFISLILLATGVFGFFISLDLFTMFLFYELAVIPMYLLIGIWGSGPKEYAAMKLTLMLMTGSALLIVGILGLYFYSGAEGQPTFDLVELSKRHFPLSMQRFFFPFLFVGFGILGALFPFHTWSPDGHSSAPTAVSMLHAGVLMKMGGYGCFRVAMFLLPEAAHEMAWIFIILTSISVVYGALGAIWQKDLKYINAYSSVSHCGLVLFALLMLNQTAINGALLQMISHGLMTALFFALIGMMYGRTHTRHIDAMGGLMNAYPFISVAYLIAGLASLGLPGLSGFVAEMTVFLGAFQHAGVFYRALTIMVTTSIVITAVYILRVVGRLVWGEAYDPAYRQLPDATWYERTGIVVLAAPVFFIGIMPSFLSGSLMEGLKPVMEKILAVM